MQLQTFSCLKDHDRHSLPFPLPWTRKRVKRRDNWGHEGPSSPLSINLASKESLGLGNRIWGKKEFLVRNSPNWSLFPRVEGEEEEDSPGGSPHERLSPCYTFLHNRGTKCSTPLMSRKQRGGWSRSKAWNSAPDEWPLVDQRRVSLIGSKAKGNTTLSASFLTRWGSFGGRGDGEGRKRRTDGLENN